MIISDVFGVPFVPTTGRSVKRIFDSISLKKSDIFYDLGCGDGRLVFFVAKKYGVRAVGVERNPLLNFVSNIRKQVLKIPHVEFLRKNLFDVNLSEATIIYLFLFPEVVEKLKGKLLTECKKNTIIVSHGFKINGWTKRLYFTREEKPFLTFYYRI
jgi:SAM-dependent methyltransferase